jgi:uncharacterized protein with HEPN domain
MTKRSYVVWETLRRDVPELQHGIEEMLNQMKSE